MDRWVGGERDRVKRDEESANILCFAADLDPVPIQISSPDTTVHDLKQTAISLLKVRRTLFPFRLSSESICMTEEAFASFIAVDYDSTRQKKKKKVPILTRLSLSLSVCVLSMASWRPLQ